ncbi:MAG: hypothetical protein M0Z78_00790 [Betaproteobacteria bacterium]|nr:hypothetical protein [Betaproteobacteria bacterium]
MHSQVDQLGFSINFWLGDCLKPVVQSQVSLLKKHAPKTTQSTASKPSGK